MHTLLLTVSGLLLVLNTLIVFSLMLPCMVLKTLAPTRAWAQRALMALAGAWNAVNDAWLRRINRHADVRIDLPPGLNRQGWYLVLSNHQSWVDILMLQRAFNGRIPFLKFFLKQELIWVPFAGQAWWALDYPFLRRKGAASAMQDVQAGREACAKFRAVPTSVMSFVEGTRLTPSKHAGSPYRHLLRPKAGAVMATLDVLGPQLDAVLDVTIAYPRGVPSFIDLLAGRLGAMHMRIQPRQPPALDSDAQRQRAQVQAWLNTLWQEKDATLEAMLRAGKPPG